MSSAIYSSLLNLQRPTPTSKISLPLALQVRNFPQDRNVHENQIKTHHHGRILKKCWVKESRYKKKKIIQYNLWLSIAVLTNCSKASWFNETEITYYCSWFLWVRYLGMAWSNSASGLLLRFRLQSTAFLGYSHLKAWLGLGIHFWCGSITRLAAGGRTQFLSPRASSKDHLNLLMFPSEWTIWEK